MRKQAWICHTCKKEGCLTLGIREDEPAQIIYLIESDHDNVSPKCLGKAEPFYDYSNNESAMALREMMAFSLSSNFYRTT